MAIKDYSFNGSQSSSLVFEGTVQSDNDLKLEYTLQKIGKIFDLECSYVELSVACSFTGEEVSDFLEVEYFANKRVNQPTDRMKRFVQDWVYRYLEKVDQLVFRLDFIADDIQALLAIQEIGKKEGSIEPVGNQNEVVVESVGDEQVKTVSDLETENTHEDVHKKQVPILVTKTSLESDVKTDLRKKKPVEKKEVLSKSPIADKLQKKKSKPLKRRLSHFDYFLESRHSQNQIGLDANSPAVDQLEHKNGYKTQGFRYFDKGVSFMPGLLEIPKSIKRPINLTGKNRRLIGANKVFEGPQLPPHVSEKSKKIIERHSKFDPEFGKTADQESLFFTTDLGFKEGSETDYIQVLVYKNKDMVYIVAESSYFKYSYEITALTKRLILKKLDKILLDFRYLKYVLTNFLEKDISKTALTVRDFKVPADGVQTLRQIATGFGINPVALDATTESETQSVVFKLSLGNAKDGVDNLEKDFGPSLPALSASQRLYFKIQSPYCSFTYVKDYPTISTFDTAFLPMMFYKTVVGILERQFRTLSDSFPEWYDIDFVNPFVDMFEVLYPDSYNQISHLTGRLFRFPYKKEKQNLIFGHYNFKRMEVESMAFGGNKYENTWDYVWENRAATNVRSDLLLGYEKFIKNDPPRVQPVLNNRERKVEII